MPCLSAGFLCSVFRKKYTQKYTKSIPEVYPEDAMWRQAADPSGKSVKKYNTKSFKMNKSNQNEPECVKQYKTNGREALVSFKIRLNLCVLYGKQYKRRSDFLQISLESVGFVV